LCPGKILGSLGNKARKFETDKVTMRINKALPVKGVPMVSYYPRKFKALRFPLFVVRKWQNVLKDS
jgi:hypothetical protein